MRSAAEALYAETGDPRWLEPEYARRMAGPTMAAKWKARRKAEARAECRRDPLFVYLKRMLCSARKNSSRKGLPCTLTDDQLRTLLESAQGRCMVTGVPFSLERHAAGRSPLAPSLDRRSDAKGYTLENVRLVCQIANLAMNVWDADTLMDFIRKARA